MADIQRRLGSDAADRAGPGLLGIIFAFSGAKGSPPINDILMWSGLAMAAASYLADPIDIITSIVVWRTRKIVLPP